MRRQRRRLPKRISVASKLNLKLFWLCTLLTCLGVIIIADVSAPQSIRVFGTPLHFAKQQFYVAVLGLVTMTVLSFVNYKIWEMYALPVFAITLVLLLLVLIPGVGSNFLGARRWIVLGPVNFQPSELAKLSIIMIISKLAVMNYDYKYSLSALVLVAALIMLQPDLGTTLLIAAIGFSIIFVSGMPLLKLGLASAGGGLVAFLLIIASAYRRQRLETFIQNILDPLGSQSPQAADAAYHIRQILIALGSGGFLGVGIGQSKQKHLFLPETATDSIFAIIAEEIGFIGAIFFIGIFAYFILLLLRISLRAKDPFAKYFATGATAWVGGQTLLNLTSMVAITPLTGIPLPFVSFGGTSLLVLLATIGIVLNIDKHAV